MPNPADLPAQTALPDPLVMLDGRKVTTREMWFNERRPELSRLFQHYMFEVMRAAAPVYRLLRAGDFTAEALPPDGQWIDGVLGFYLRPGGHSLLREDWQAFLDFADKHLGAPSARTSRVATGPILIDPEHPHSFRYHRGERFFPMGDTAYFLIAQPTNVIAQFIDVRRAHRFNFIRMLAMADGHWPFGGTPDRPDYTAINETALQKLDWVFDYAASRDMNIELILWGYGIAGGEGLWARPSYQELWVDTLVKRYRERSNLFMYTTRWQGVDYPVTWTEAGWQFDAAGLEDCIAEDRARGKPVLNTEFGYQYEPGYESHHGYTTRQVHQPATVRRKAWKIATAGGYFAAGFAGTAVSRSFTPGDVNNFRPASLAVLYDFFTKKTEYWKMSPHLELVASHNVLLAFPGTEYVAYFPRGGTNSIELAAGGYHGEWLHPATGRSFTQPHLIAAGGSQKFAPPEPQTDDWVLHLRRTNIRFIPK